MRDLASVTTSTVESTTVVSIAGDVDCSNALEVLGPLAQQLSVDASVLVIDLSRCDYLDSAGIREVLKLQTDLRARRQQLVLVVDPDSAVHRVLTIVGALEHVPWHASLDAAIESST